jgi:Flp pilus assembly protein TadD
MQKLKEGDFEAAIVHLREAVRLDAGNAQAHYQLSVALRRHGAGDEAAAHLAEARRLAPDLVPADAR